MLRSINTGTLIIFTNSPRAPPLFNIVFASKRFFSTKRFSGNLWNYGHSSATTNNTFVCIEHITLLLQCIPTCWSPHIKTQNVQSQGALSARP